MLIQSQHDDTQINADQNITVTAGQGKITYMANTEVLNVVAGGAYIKLDGPNIEVGVPADYTVKAASHDWIGPASMSPVLPQFSQSVCEPCRLKARKSGSQTVAR